MKLKVYTKDGSSFTEEEFENIPQFEGEKGLVALKETLVAYQANARQGTTKSPIHRGGAVVFGPKPRDWSKKINRRVKALAFSRALFDRCVDNSICVIEQFEASEPKTKIVSSMLGKIKPEGKVLLIDDVFEDKFVLAGRNIARVNFCETNSLSAMELVRFDNIIVSRKGLDTVIARANKD